MRGRWDAGTKGMGGREKLTFPQVRQFVSKITRLFNFVGRYVHLCILAYKRCKILTQHIQIRSEVVAALNEKCKSPGKSPWSKIIDVKVYTGTGGLRMLGSLKVKTCTACHGDDKRRRHCVECCGTFYTYVCAANDAPYG